MLKNLNFSLTKVCCRIILFPIVASSFANAQQSACTIVPVAVNGFNADVVAEGTGGNAVDKTTHTVDAFYTFYSKDFVPTNPHSSGASAIAYGGGLPTNGTLAASSLSGLVFQMANYSANNALILRNNVTNTGSLTFTNPKKAEKIYVAAVRGEGGSGTSDNHNVTATIHFADGTAQSTVFQATAWWFDSNAPSNIVIAGTGEISRNTATTGWAPRNEFRGLTQASLYYNVLAVDTANQNKNITSIDFNKTVTSNAAHTTAILAVSICETAATTPVCNNTEPGTNPGDIGCVTFNYRGQPVTYTTVRGADGKIWLQQNLGSTKIATSLTDSEAYGDLFQWGRWDDGHQLRNSSLSSSAPSPNNPSGLNGGNAAFYSAGYNSSSNFWSGGITSDTWSAANSTAVTRTNGADPCKAIGSDWRLPTINEINTILTAENITEFNSALSSHLKLIPAGMKDYNGIFSPGTRLYLWSSSSSPNTGSGQHLYVSQYSALSNSIGRDAGLSVRCIKATTTSLATVDIKNKVIDVYPNPTNGIVTVKTDTPIETVAVTNLGGQRLKVNYFNNQINLQELPNGVYIIELTMKNGQQILRKVIKN